MWVCEEKNDLPNGTAAEDGDRRVGRWFEDVARQN